MGPGGGVVDSGIPYGRKGRLRGSHHQVCPLSLALRLATSWGFRFNPQHDPPGAPTILPSPRWYCIILPTILPTILTPLFPPKATPYAVPLPRLRWPVLYPWPVPVNSEREFAVARNLLGANASGQLSLSNVEERPKGNRRGTREA